MKNSPHPFYGWIVVAASTIILVVVWGAQYSYGVFFKPLSEDLGWTRAVTSGAFSLFFVTHAFTQPLTGLIGDKYGAKYPILICGLGTGIGYLLMSQLKSLSELYIYYGVIIGICATFAYVPLVSTVTRWFIGRRGLALGLVVSGVSLGTIIMAPVSQLLISAFDWRFAYIVVACLLFFLVTPMALVIVSDPAQKGLRPYGQSLAQDSSSKLLTLELGLNKSMGTKAFWLLGVSYLLLMLCAQMVLVHTVNHATDHGIDKMTAATILSVVGGFSVVGRISFGFTSDKIGRKACLMAAFLLQTLGLLWLVFAKEVYAFYLFAVVFGLGYGGAVSLYPAVVGEYFGLSAHGITFGVILTIAGIGGAIGPFLGGYIFDVTGSYTRAFSLAAASAAVAVVTTSFLKSPQIRYKVPDVGTF